MAGAYYNEIDPKAAAWLRGLISQGHIAPGDVDERSIADVTPVELSWYTQCHFFAGIGVWSYALRQAGWPDDRPVWTGSCPCQPFSSAGKGAGFADERHLWPLWYWLIQQCGPRAVFGEQVAGKAGETWLDLVQTDLENTGYSSGAAVTAACGFGAPHQRKRLYWVADSSSKRLWREPVLLQQRGSQQESPEATGGCKACCMGNSDQHDGEAVAGVSEGPRVSTPRDPVCPGETNGHWGDSDWLLCRDSKWRAVEPGTFPLANGAAERVGRLRGYGNALVAPQAQAFIESYMEVCSGHSS